jgi:dTDP-3,4-didehydro-2,6-dideoxy-alpha-D-glucose 3-reductase
MQVLLIGYGSLAKRRIVPALESLDSIETIHVAEMFGGIPANAVSKEKRGRRFDDFHTAINTCGESLVYVSQPNSVHALWTLKALEAGHHVIVDKPAVTELADAERICDLAITTNRCAAEANVWFHHPIVENLKQIICRQKSPPLAIYATFTSPEMSSDNFRYRTDMGGGALLDRASYAISCGRVLLGGVPSGIYCRKSPQLKTREVDTSFSLLLNYENGATLLAFMSIEAEYRNSIEVIGSDYTLDVHRLFTPPQDYEATIEMRQSNDSKTIRVCAGDTFARFISEVVKSIEAGDSSHYSRVLLEDAQVMEAIRMSAKGERL